MFKFNETEPVIEADVIFGMRSCNCSGHGICTLYPPNIIEHGKCDFHSARSWFNQMQSGHLLILFDINSMRPDTIIRYFSNGFFRIGEQVEIPPFIYNKLGFPSLFIKNGKYKLELIFGFFCVLIEQENLSYRIAKKNIPTACKM